MNRTIFWLKIFGLLLLTVNSVNLNAQKYCWYPEVIERIETIVNENVDLTISEDLGVIVSGVLEISPDSLEFFITVIENQDELEELSPIHITVLNDRPIIFIGLKAKKLFTSCDSLVFDTRKFNETDILTWLMDPLKGYSTYIPKYWLSCLNPNELVSDTMFYEQGVPFRLTDFD